LLYAPTGVRKNKEEEEEEEEEGIKLPITNP